MTAWSESDVAVLDAAPSLHLTAGGDRLHAVEVGMVVVAGELYVRAFRGRMSEWYRAAIHSGHGRINVAGLTREINISAYAGEPDPIDAAYLGKYGADAALVTNPAARDATLRLAVQSAAGPPPMPISLPSRS